VVESTDRFSLIPLDRADGLPPDRGRLARDGKPTAVVVEGTDIAAQYAFGKAFLVATVYDYFEGASHWFHLIDSAGAVLDRVSPPDCFGFLEGVRVLGERTIGFGFYGSDERWTLSVNERGYWSFRPAEVARRGGLFLLRKRRLSLQRTRARPHSGEDPAG
jgi:hypothetical protein